MALSLTEMEARVTELEGALADKQARTKALVDAAFAPVKALQQQLDDLLKVASREDDAQYQSTINQVVGRISAATQQLTQSVGAVPTAPTL